MKKIKSDPSRTVLTISMGFLAICFFTKIEWTLHASLIIGIIGIFSNYLSKKIEFLWFKLAWILGLIIPNFLLTIIFYLLLYPIALLSKLFKNSDSLQLKNNSESTFTLCNKEFDKKSFKNPW